jgi:hypothetical protein
MWEWGSCNFVGVRRKSLKLIESRRLIRVSERTEKEKIYSQDITPRDRKSE